jgi:hypothetical protein
MELLADDIAITIFKSDGDFLPNGIQSLLFSLGVEVIAIVAAGRQRE